LKAQEALQAAQADAEDHQNSQVQPEHLLWALAKQKSGVVLPILQKLGADLPTLAESLATLIGNLPKLESRAEAQLSDPLGRVLDASLTEAAQFKDQYVSTEHILMAMSVAKGEEVARLLSAHGVNKDAILKVLVSIRGTQKSRSKVPKRSTKRWSDTPRT